MERCQLMCHKYLLFYHYNSTWCAYIKRHISKHITTTTKWAKTKTPAALSATNLRHIVTRTRPNNVYSLHSATLRAAAIIYAVCGGARASATTATTITKASSSLSKALFCASMGSCFGRCVSKETHAATTSCLWQRATDEQEAELMSNASDKYERENIIFRIIKFKRKQKRRQFIDNFWENQHMSYDKLTNKNGNESITDIQLQNLDVNNLFHTTTIPKESALNHAPSTQTCAAIGSSRASSSLDLEWEHEYARQLYTQHAPHGATQNAHYINSSNNNNNYTHDNHCAQLNNDSWQFLTQDEDQLNSLTSLNSLSLPMQAGESQAGASLQRLTTRMHNGKLCGARNNGGSFTRTSSHNSWSHISTPESLEWDQDEEQQRQMRVEDDNLDHETLELLHQIEQLKNRVLHETGDGGELFEGNIVRGDSIEFGNSASRCSESQAEDVSNGIS